MAFAVNLLWFIFGGWLSSLAWYIFGFLLCLTVIGMPFGIAAFRIAGFVAFPFGRELIDKRLVGEERKAGTGIANFLWIILAGLWLAITHALLGLACFISIIGIPFGLAHFKIAAISFAPLGKIAVNKDLAAAARSRAANSELDRRLPKGETPKYNTAHNAPSTTIPRSNDYKHISKIKKLLDGGALTQEEFDREKQRILSQGITAYSKAAVSEKQHIPALPIAIIASIIAVIIIFLIFRSCASPAVSPFIYSLF